MKKGAVSIISALTGMVVGASAVGKVSGDKTKKFRSMSDKHLALFLMMNQWVRVKQDGKNLVSYFEKNGYKKIAVYGMSYAGQTLVHELQNTGINVAYGIDNNPALIDEDVEIVSVDDELEPVDAVVVTAITFFDEIQEKLAGKVDCSIISLEDILYEV